MPWVRFTRDFDFKPKVSVTLAYLSGQERLVTTPCAELAIAKQKAVAIDDPARPAAAGVADTIARAPRRRKKANGAG